MAVVIWIIVIFIILFIFLTRSRGKHSSNDTPKRDYRNNNYNESYYRNDDYNESKYSENKSSIHDNGNSNYNNKVPIKLGPPREELPHSIRKQIYRRANEQCENPFCHSGGRLDIHHIDMNHNNNRLYNLIALCPNCHADAHSGKYPPTQVHNWMSMDYQRLLHRQTKFD
jgi:5-methylcytosine-specific restriction endonuclease McrA